MPRSSSSALLGTASLDGLEPATNITPPRCSRRSKPHAADKRKDVERADRALSDAFVAYVDDLRQDPGVGITYVDPR